MNRVCRTNVQGWFTNQQGTFVNRQGTFVNWLIIGIFLTTNLFANPAGEIVKHGTADFVRDGASLRVLQGTDKLIIDWESFSIASGEVTEFIQPASTSAALNRVYGASASQIDGLLKANGRIFLINQNGIVVGPGGQIDVGGFVASSLDVSDADFLAGGDMTFSGNARAGAVVNLGTINARDGDVFLFGPRVENAGSISAPNGTVGLGGGTKVLLKASGDERVFVEGEGTVVNSGTVNANIAELKAHGGNVYAMAIKNSGRVTATGVTTSGGQIFLTGRGGKISNSGTLKARRSNGSGGRVKIDAGGPTDGGEIKLEPGSVIDVKGDSGAGGIVELFSQNLIINDGATVDASGETDGGTITIESGHSFIAGQLLALGGTGIGGRISVAAETLVIDDSAVMDVSGAAGGGEIFAGGGFAGNDPEMENAETTEVRDGAIFRANSLVGGDAGRIAIWADNATTFAGTIEARALGNSGHGGFAEVSGKIHLDFTGSVSLTGAGVDFNNGTLLLDPTDFTINAGTATAIQTTLNGGTNVVVSTAAAGGGNGDIFVNAGIQTNPGTTASLALLAHRHVFLDQSIQIDGTGDLTVVAGWDGATGFGGVSGVVNGPTVSPAGFNSLGSTAFGNNGGSVFVNENRALGAASDRVSVGSRSGTTRVVGHDIQLLADTDPISAFGDHAMIGFYAADQGLAYTIPGDIVVLAKNDVLLQSSDSLRAAAQIGHIGASNVTTGFPGPIVPGGDATATGAIRVQSGNDITFAGGAGNNSYAQIGHGGGATFGSRQMNLSGLIDIDAGRDINLNQSVVTARSYHMIGHGGVSMIGAISGDIDVTTGRHITLTGTGVGGVTEVSGFGSYSQIGHGGSDGMGSINGNISVNTIGGGNLAITGGDGPRSYAQIGHGGAFSVATTQGGVNVNGFNNITLNSGDASHTQIGHASRATNVGTINVTGNNLSLQGGGAALASGLTATNYSKVGHGYFDGSANGNINVTMAGTSTLQSGAPTTGFFSSNFAQVGHGSFGNAASVQTGNITFNTGNLNMVNSTGGDPYVMVGHGAQNGLYTGSVTGFTQVIAQNNINMTNSQIGHGTTGSYLGDTFIGVGQSNPTSGGTGSLTADVNSIFVSESATTGGELRFYAGTRSDLNIALGTDLNGVPLGSNNPFPNEQGFHLYGNGPYSGNFSFYFGESPVVAPTAAPALPPQDPTGILLPEIDAFQVDRDIEVEPYLVENQFYDNAPSRIGNNLTNTITFQNVERGTEPTGAPTGIGGFPTNFVIEDGLITNEFGVIGFETGGQVEIVPPPAEVAAMLGEQLGENAVFETVPDGMVQSDTQLVAFGENGVVKSLDRRAQFHLSEFIGTGAAVELGSTIDGVPADVPVPGGVVYSQIGPVGFGNTSSTVNATMPPPEIANMLAEALGESAHDGNPAGVKRLRLGAHDGVAESTEAGSIIPQTVEQSIDATFGQALGEAALLEMEGAFGD